MRETPSEDLPKRSWERAVEDANLAVTCDVGSITGLGLRVASGKTEAVFFHDGSAAPPPRAHISMGETQIQVEAILKYLG